jgi:hypothetical protein
MLEAEGGKIPQSLFQGLQSLLFLVRGYSVLKLQMVDLESWNLGWG